MSAIILRSSSILSAPKPGTPILPDVDTNLYFDTNADLLIGSTGSDITNMVASGPAPVPTRTFNKNMGNSAEWPKLSLTDGPEGGKCIMFNGNARITNMEGTTGTALTNVVAQPHTDMVVAYVNNETQGNNRRLIGGTTGFLHNIIPASSGECSISASVLVSLGIVLPLASWFAFGIALDGASSKAILPNGTIVPLPSSPGTDSYGGTVYGMNNTASPANNGLKGRLKRHMMWNRFMNDNDFAAAHAYLKRLYGIA